MNTFDQEREAVAAELRAAQARAALTEFEIDFRQAKERYFTTRREWVNERVHALAVASTAFDLVAEVKRLEREFDSSDEGMALHSDYVAFKATLSSLRSDYRTNWRTILQRATSSPGDAFADPDTLSSDVEGAVF